MKYLALVLLIAVSLISGLTSCAPRYGPHIYYGHTHNGYHASTHPFMHRQGAGHHWRSTHHRYRAHGRNRIGRVYWQ